MTMSERVIEVLNNDSKVKTFMNTAKQAAINTNLSETEWNNAKETLMLMSIQMCPEAMKIMAEETYKALRGEN